MHWMSTKSLELSNATNQNLGFIEVKSLARGHRACRVRADLWISQGTLNTFSIAACTLTWMTRQVILLEVVWTLPFWYWSELRCNLMLGFLEAELEMEMLVHGEKEQRREASRSRARVWSELEASCDPIPAVVRQSLPHLEASRLVL